MSKNFESEQEESANDSALSRRKFLISLGKWSPAVIGGFVLGGVTGNAEAWNNRGGSWVNRSGGGSWVNRSGGGWHNRGGSWANRSGGGWHNRSGGWHNRGGSWINR